MNAPPYQKWFWGSYHKHTAHLRHGREHGAFMLLIGALWNNDGKLPADDATLAAYAMLPLKEWAAVKPKLMPLFRVVRGKLTQPRVTEDLANYRSTSGKRKEAGKLGGNASAGKRMRNRAAIATGLPTKSEPEPEGRIEASKKASIPSRRVTDDERTGGSSSSRSEVIILEEVKQEIAAEEREAMKANVRQLLADLGGKRLRKP